MYFSLFHDVAFLVLVQQKSQWRFVFFGGWVWGFSCFDGTPYSAKIGSCRCLRQIHGAGNAMLATTLKQEHQDEKELNISCGHISYASRHLLRWQVPFFGHPALFGVEKQAPRRYTARTI